MITLELEVTVEENEAPKILLSNSEITLDILNFKEYDQEFFKNYIIDITDNFTEEFSVLIDVSLLKEKVADYVVTFSVVDQHGNVCKEKMTVKLREFVGPTLIGEDVIYVDLNSEVDILSLIEVVDLYDSMAHTRLEVIESNLDINKDGVYEVKYQCFNNSGRCSEKTITIVVGQGSLEDLSDESLLEKIDIKTILIVVFALSSVIMLVIILIRKKHK
jgi:hypothetical protein